jgi:nitrogen fixation protein NifZ
MINQRAPRPATIARVVHDARRRRVEQSAWVAGKPDFKLGDAVRSLALVSNDGIYPHKDIGETLVQKGDAGVVRESWSFLGEMYYTVEFATRAVVVIMRGREMVRASWR